LAEPIRKQCYDLRPEDLERFPIWEHALDEEREPGQDEATVKPRPDLTVADPGEGLLLARAELTARDGTRYDGYVYPSQVNFWCGAFPPKPPALAAAYELLGKSAEQLFPVKFQCVVEYEGATLEGDVSAFMHYEHLGSKNVVEVK
jgi:hypothetical protein